ncbi:hypothetical protein ACFLQ2_04410 [archaeon]
MQIDLTFIQAFGTAFFFLLFLVSAYLYGANPKNKIPAFLSIAMMFLFIREALYFLSDSGVFNGGFKIFGGIISFFAGVLFLYVFIAEEKAMKDIRRIRNAFK